MKLTSKDLRLDCLRRDRTFLMGAAIMLVVFYHMWCWLLPTMGMPIFRYGFIGVDIFFFVGAFGLCYSYEAHAIREFYWRRIIRIMPLFIFYSLVQLGAKTIFTDVDIAAQLKWLILYVTTLAYYLPACGDHGNWFVSAFILLYIAFPFLYWLVSKIKMTGVLIICALFFIAAHSISPYLTWWHDCLVSRIPIFMLGIETYRMLEKKESVSGFHVTGWLAIYMVAAQLGASRFYLAAVFCPVCILAFEYISDCAHIRQVLEYFGRHSFELFFAHCALNNFVFSRVDANDFFLHHFGKFGGGLECGAFLFGCVPIFLVFVWVNQLSNRWLKKS